ncbi:FecR family protein [Dyadobacter sandarakinus]|uniref:FecR domain-containing protein n=1 Tax=Dyadobacter sandarakinus TaxID=2747268 RepID=A0ABX7I5H8_9BACT|nr:FecR domain-containing protein [Dyadobacter sandarakinus]QRR00747.1 FecR domain-containing protein [Dyadobacter sandarakinus]
MKKRVRKSEHLPESESPDLSEDEKRIAANTRILMKSVQEEALPVLEKTALRLRMEETIELQGTRTFRGTWLAVAASVALLLVSVSGYFLLRQNTGSAMQEEASKLTFDTADTRLQLADRRIVRLSEQNADLVYKQDGLRIQIDSASVVEQRTADQAFNTLTVPYGKRSTVTLVDGTKIWLNSGSKLVYPSTSDGKTREVYLEGQAYFSVSHADDIPFFVHTKNMKVQVFGTEFDVSAYDDDPQSTAVLVKGSIELTANQKSFFGSKKKKLTPGTMAAYDPGTSELQTSQVDVASYISWKEGYLILNKVPLPDILRKLGRYYRADISLGSADARNMTFSGRLDLQEDIAPVLDIIAATTSLNYQQTERRFIFR